MTEIEDYKFQSAEAAAMIGVDKSTLLRWERAGKIPAASRSKRTNARLYTRADIDAIKRWKDAMKLGGAAKL